jgi:hypothetical protein
MEEHHSELLIRRQNASNVRNEGIIISKINSNVPIIALLCEALSAWLTMAFAKCSVSHYFGRFFWISEIFFQNDSRVEIAANTASQKP